MACGRALSTHRAQWDRRRHEMPRDPVPLVQGDLKPLRTELALVEVSRRGRPLRRQARGWLGSPGGTWLQSEALPRAPAHGPGLGPPKALRRRAGAEPRHGRGSPGPMRPRIRGRQRRGHAGTSPTFSSGGILLLQDDPLPVQTRYGGAKVQGLLLTTLQTKTGHGVTQTGTFWTAACGPATKTGLSQAPRSHRPRDPRSCRLGGLPQRAPEVPRPGGLRPVSNS